MSYTLLDFDYKLVFDLQETIPSIKVRSKLNSTSNQPSRVDLVFKIIDPLGNVIYDNTDLSSPDLTVVTQTYVDSNVIVPIPTDQNGDLIIGNYVLEGSARVYSLVQSADDINNYFFISEKPIGFFNTPFVYEVIDSPTSQEGIYNISNVTNINLSTRLDSTDNIPAPSGGPALFVGYGFVVGEDLSLGKTVKFCEDSFEKKVSLTFSCLKEEITGKDLTPYPLDSIIVSKLQKLYYPIPLGKDPVETTENVDSISVVGDLYTTNWTYTLNTLFEYTYNNQEDLVIIDVVNLSDQVNVECPYNQCKTLCCINNLQQRLNGLTPKSSEYNKVSEQLNRATTYVYIIETALNCGNTKIYQDAIEGLNSILNTSDTQDCGCGCSDSSADPNANGNQDGVPEKVKSPIIDVPPFVGVNKFVELLDTADEIEPLLFFFGDAEGEIVEQRVVATSDIAPAFNATTLIDPKAIGTFLPSTDFWRVTKNNGDPYTFLATSPSSVNMQVDVGCLVDVSVASEVTVPNAGESLPTEIDVAGQNEPVPSPPAQTGSYTESGIIASSSFVITYTKPSSGFVVSGSQVIPATGNDTTTDSISVAFRNRVYFGEFPNGSTINEGLIKSLSSEKFGDKSETYTGVTDGPGNVLGFFYPESEGTINSIILNDSIPVIGAWTQQGTIAFINEGGVSVPMTGIISNTLNSYNNAKLQFS